MSESRYWIGVVSRSHVERGAAGGFAQLCHGKAAPLRRMKAGDWLVYYSPKEDMKGNQPLQAFTAIGRVRDDEVYSFAMSETFVPFRRDVDYLPCQAASIRPLIEDLHFIRDKQRWGYPFRTGQIEIDEHDFRLIASAMGVEVATGVAA